MPPNTLTSSRPIDRDPDGIEETPRIKRSANTIDRFNPVTATSPKVFLLDSDDSISMPPFLPLRFAAYGTAMAPLMLPRMVVPGLDTG
jgi:hypothetical protein